MTDASSLVALLRWRALYQPSHDAYIFLLDGERQEVKLTYEAVDQQARLIAAQLQQMAEVGDRVLLLYPSGLDYITAFFGCLYANMVAVPAYAPSRNRTDRRLQAIAEDAQPTVVLTTSSVLAHFKRHSVKNQALTVAPWLATDQIDQSNAEAWQAVEGGYAFDKAQRATDIYLPFELLGISDPAASSLSMVAFATEEHALWSTMPAGNNVNSERVAKNLSDEPTSFILLKRYEWPLVANGSTSSSSTTWVYTDTSRFSQVGSHTLWIEAEASTLPSEDNAGNITQTGPYPLEVTAPSELYLPLISHFDPSQPVLPDAPDIALGGDTVITVTNPITSPPVGGPRGGNHDPTL